MLLPIETQVGVLTVVMRPQFDMATIQRPGILVSVTIKTLTKADETWVEFYARAIEKAEEISQ